MPNQKEKIENWEGKIYDFLSPVNLTMFREERTEKVISFIKGLLKSEKAKERQEFIEILEGLEMKDIGFCHLPECQQQDTNDLPCDCGIAQRNDLYDIFREKQNQKIQEVIKIFKDEK